MFAATSFESALRSKVQGFAFDTNRWVFVSMLASAFLFAVTDILSLEVIFGLALAMTSGLLAQLPRFHEQIMVAPQLELALHFCES